MTRRLSLSVPDEVYDWLRDAASRTGRTMGQVVTALLAAYPLAELSDDERAELRQQSRRGRRRR